MQPDMNAPDSRPVARTARRSTAASPAASTPARVCCEAALRLFAEKGYAQTSTREICVAAGVNAASIHYYFSDKAGLYRAVYLAPIQQLMVAARAIADAGEPFEATMRQDLRGLPGAAEAIATPGRCRSSSCTFASRPIRPGWPATRWWRSAQSHFDALVAMLAREIGSRAPDDDLRRLASSLIALAVDFLTSADWLRQIAPALHAGPEAIDRMSERLTGYAVAMLAYERTPARRCGATAARRATRRMSAALPRVLAPRDAWRRCWCRCCWRLRHRRCPIRRHRRRRRRPGRRRCRTRASRLCSRSGGSDSRTRCWPQLVDDGPARQPRHRRIAGAHRQARATAVVAGASRLPTLDANGQILRRSTPEPPAVAATIAGVSLDALWELDLFGANRRTREAALARVDARTAEWHDARVTLAAEVAAAYANLRLCEALLQVYREDLASQRVVLDLTRRKVRSGFSAPADAALIDAAAAEAEQPGAGPAGAVRPAGQVAGHA